MISMKKALLVATLFLFLVPALPGERQADDGSMPGPGGAEIQVPPMKPVPITHAIPVADLTVCVSNGKTPPIGGKRDIHVRVTNNSENPVRGLKLAFFVEGKGIENYDIAEIGGKRTYLKTRNHSWSTVGTKKITAMVYMPGYKERALVEGAYRVRLAGTPSDSSGEGDKCSDVRIMTPVEKATVDLTVCISNGKTAPIGGKRDIHVWVKNNGDNAVEGIRLTFYVEGKPITTHDIPFLEGKTTKKITRNHSWATAGTKSLSANVRVSGKTGLWSVNGAYRVRPAGSPSDSSGEGIKCSDGSKPGDLK
jgi:CARDB